MKKLLLILLAAFSIAAASADAPGYILIKSAQQEKCLEVTEVASLTFDDTNLAVNTTNAQTFLFPNDENWNISFSPVSGINATIACGTPSRVAVYDLRGVKVAESSSLSDLDLNALPSGVYVVTSSGKTKKIIR